MTLHGKMIAMGSALVGTAAIAVVINTVASEKAHPRPTTLSLTSSHQKLRVTHGMITLPSVALRKAQQEMPFPVIKPPTNRFPIDSISATTAPGAPHVEFDMGKLFHGAGLIVLEQDHKVTIGAPNEKTTTLAGYKATTARWVNAVKMPIASASIYNGIATYTVIGTHVSLSLVESTLITMLGH